MGKMDQMPMGDIRREITEGKIEHEESKKLESKETGNSMIFRDGEGFLYEIYKKANTYAGSLIPGGAGHESSEVPFEFATIKETEGWVEEEGSNDGDNLLGYGGLHFSQENWKGELADRTDIPSDVKEAIEKSITRFETERQ